MREPNDREKQIAGQCPHCIAGLPLIGSAPLFRVEGEPAGTLVHYKRIYKRGRNGGQSLPEIYPCTEPSPERNKEKP